MTSDVSILIDVALSGGLLLMVAAWQKKLTEFALEMQTAAPEAWQGVYGTNSTSTTTPRRKLLCEYVWKREYLKLDSPSLTRIGNKCRLLHVGIGFWLTALAAYYLVPFILSLAANSK